MQLRNMKLMLVTLGAMSMVLTGCPEDMKALTCMENADCLESELCHPTAKVCVQTCTSSADCPDTAKTCAAMTGSSQMICQCSTDALCNQGRETADLACDPTSKVCVPKCTADADCATGQTCDTTAGICKAAAQTCNPANQPGTCSYGQVCSATANKCEAAPQGTCSQATGAPAWNQTGGTAPVIVSVTATRLSTTNTTTQCGDGGPAGLVTIRFYAPGGLTTHTTLTDLQRHVKAKLNASASFVGPSFASKEPPANDTDDEMVVGFCGPATAQGAIYIANEAGQTSNVPCVSW
jgi:Cys-rich repeat protein